MGVMTRQTLSAAAALILGIGLSGCGRWLGAAPTPEDQWEEVFEFEIEQGTMNPAEVEELLADRGPMGRIVPGSALHRATVQAPSGTVDFFIYRVVDSEMGPQPQWCESTTFGSGMSSGCGGEERQRPSQPVQMTGESFGGTWRTGEFLVQDDVVRVEATATDGTVYTVTPRDGFGFVEWPDERGSLELVAYNAEDEELGRAFAGLDR